MEFLLLNKRTTRKDFCGSGEQIGYLRELKPNNSWGRNAGYKQLARYIEAASEKFPDVSEWRPYLDLYESGAGSFTGMFHMVQEGDNLSTIAEMYGTTVENIIQLNNIEDADKIKVGEELMIDFSINTFSFESEEYVVPPVSTGVGTVQGDL